MARAGTAGQDGEHDSIWTIRRSATDAKLTGCAVAWPGTGGSTPSWSGWVRCCSLSAAASAIVLYLAGWLLIPVDGREPRPSTTCSARSARKWPRGGVGRHGLVACVLTFAIFGAAMPFGFGPAIVLALIWYFGYYKNRRAAGAPRPRGPAAATAGPRRAAAGSRAVPLSRSGHSLHRGSRCLAAADGGDGAGRARTSRRSPRADGRTPLRTAPSPVSSPARRPGFLARSTPSHLSALR